MTDTRKQKALELAKMYLEFYKRIRQENENSNSKKSFSLSSFIDTLDEDIPKTTLRDLFTKALPAADKELSNIINSILDESRHFKENKIRSTTKEQALEWAIKFLDLNMRDENSEDPTSGISLRDFAELEGTTKSTVEDAFIKYLPLINPELSFKIGSILERHRHTLVNDKRKNIGQNKNYDIEHKFKQ